MLGPALLAACFLAVNSFASMAAENSRKLVNQGTGTRLTASKTKIRVNDTITLKAQVTPAAPAGSVTFYRREAPAAPFLQIEKVKVVEGVAKISVGIDRPGTVGFKAEYDGTHAYKKSKSNIVTVTVKK